MANSFLKVGKIAQATIQLLFRELVVARTVWTDAINGDDFVGALDDTVTLRVPARNTARTRTLRGGTPITLDEENEFAVPVKLDTDVYKGVAITDEELTLDITDFAAQILLPQVRAVAEGVETKLIAEIEGASYGAPIEWDGTDPYNSVVDARTALNNANVPKANRYLLVGSNVEAALLKSDRFVRADARGQSGATSAFEESIIGRVAGFTVIESNGLDPDHSYAYHKTAFVLAARTPKVPKGATFGEDVPLTRGEAQQVGASMGGLSARWIMDYDPLNLRDRSIVSTWVGTAAVEDPDDPSDPESATSMVRAVRIENVGS